MSNWSLTTLKEKLIKIGAKVVSHGRYIAFQMAEVATPRKMFEEILYLIAELRPKPPPALASTADGHAFRSTRWEDWAQMQSKTRNLGPENATPGSEWRPPASNRSAPSGKLGRLLPSAPNSGFIWESGSTPFRIVS